MHPTVPTVREAINQLRETSLKCLEHMVGLGVRTSTHDSTASDILAQDVHLRKADILDDLRVRYERVLGCHLFDLVPTTPEGLNYLRDGLDLLKPSNLSILECNEGDINTSHHTRLQLARHLLCFVIFEQASKKNKNGANIDLNQLEEQLNNIRVHTQTSLSETLFRVRADAMSTSKRIRKCACSF
ncbi:hypothetical protein PTI98_009044 [Pleurotus ostreatus]|nr:hypothetical protein PTI98_009044 [Pleurotus ostreatus]